MKRRKRLAIDFSQQQTAEATDIANAIETLFNGHEMQSVVYAIGMVFANFISQAQGRDSDEAFRILRAISDHELKRQFSN